MAEQEVKPGQRVRVCQEIGRREGNWRHELCGIVLAAGAEQTGSWYAHGKDGKLWLNRVHLRKDDGEITTIVVDRHTRLEVLSDASST
jgi:hypothetical protein